MKWAKFTTVGALVTVGLVVAVSVVGLISWTMIQYGASEEKTKTLIKERENYIETRKRIEDATQSIDGATPDDARKWLLERQQTK